MKTLKKLKLLRSHMAKKRIKACIVPSSDPHLSEYIPEHWKSRAWLSGFTGSSGTLVVTDKKAALWTDSRYFLQAEKELNGSGIDLCKMGLPETPTMEAWLIDVLKKKDIVAFDGRLLSHSMAKGLIFNLKSHGLKVDSNIDFIDKIWTNRPSIPKGKAFEQELRYSGKSVNEKLTEIREKLISLEANACIISTLDDIAWTFNIRGNDVEYNPVVLSYGYISLDKALLFIDQLKIDDELVSRLNLEGVDVMDYQQIDKFIKRLPKNTIIALDETRINHKLASLIPKEVPIKRTLSIPTQLKAIKNPVELENIRKSMVADGIAMCEFIYWLENALGNEKITELTIANKLLELRKMQNGFVSESFGTIAGYKEHGAIVHYSATPESAFEVKPKGFLLVDSGGQYYQGTTDITRTFHLSKPTKAEMRDYTLVLKGMIGLSMAKFPEGTRGCQLDILARSAMWSNGINYGHGTGHGVGAFLNVHEGPQSIRPNENPVTLEPGMIQSNEPALYRTGKYGIRIENLIACRQEEETEYGKFYGFETLTLCPIDTKPIDITLLLPEEREWLNNYHRLVFEKISPFLSEEVKVWLKAKTKEL
jgi:Xaa-Pro aminopeptidase